MNKFFWLKSFLIVITFLLLSGCYMLNRYIYTDKELDEHFKNKSLKPIYKDTRFLNHHLHYAVMSKNDSLPLLLLIHGAPGAWYGYMNLMEDSLLLSHFKIISVDRLGYGKSDYGKEVLSVQMQALAIKQVMEEENHSHQQVYLLGRSYGAPIAAWLAINYPQEIKKLLMVSPVIDPDKEKFFWFSKIGRWPLVKWFLPKLLNVATDEKFSHADQMRLMLPKWKRLYTPTDVLVGENDQIADTANYSFAKKNISNSNATFILVKHSGHLVTREHPKLIEDLLLDKKTEN